MLFTTPIPSVDFRFRSLAWLWRNIEARPCLSFGVGIHGFLFMVVASTYNNEFIPGTLCFYNDGFMPKLYCGESLLLLTKSYVSLDYSTFLLDVKTMHDPSSLPTQ
ncbi:unnamed protein product [Linum tenue]|uniref:Uncharacterized protein n=1 Tax=Linum tenue TaxID=586396 RepID=A0AAV0LVU7_9ROSI|nr:unnamed protein product [Linum tenue]